MNTEPVLNTPELNNPELKIAHQIADYISEAFLPDDDASPGIDEDLMHVLNSLQFLRLIVHLEKTYSIKVDNGEMTVENLGSVEKLAAFVTRKQQPGDVLLDG